MLLKDILNITNGKVFKLGKNCSIDGDFSISSLNKKGLSNFLFLPTKYSYLSENIDLFYEIPNVIQDENCKGFFIDHEHFLLNKDSQDILSEYIDKVELIIILGFT